MRSQAVVAAAAFLSIVSGAALASSETRSVPAFEGVHIASGIRATVAIGPLQPVQLEGDAEVLAKVEVVVENGQLRVGFKPDTHWNHGGEVRATIQTPRLRDLGASGGSIVTAELTRSEKSGVQASGGSELHLRGVDATDLAVQGSGGSIVEVAGRAQSLSLHLSGGSRFKGRDFSARDLEVHGSGGSEARVSASGDVRGGLSGGSQLFVRGAASARVSTSGGSQVERDD